VRLTESAIDAALAAALYSARTGIPVPGGTVLIGELSLAGEIRPVSRIKLRAKTAQGLGFNTIFAPERSAGITVAVDIKNLIKQLFS
jgi:DNA repair protein RadA/Sms